MDKKIKGILVLTLTAIICGLLLHITYNMTGGIG